MPYDTPIAMPNLGTLSTDFQENWNRTLNNVDKEMTLEDYFRRLQEVPDVMLKQVAGNHYHQGTIQPWDIISDWKLDFWSANVLKYLLRFPYKNGKEDLEKAMHYLEYLINNYDDVKEKYYMDKDKSIKSMKA